MQGQDFLIIAKKLSHSQSEVELRTAISRAYFALFNSAAQFLEGIDLPVYQSASGHGQLRNRLFNSGIDQMVDFSRALDDLRKRRNEADYNMKSTEF